MKKTMVRITTLALMVAGTSMAMAHGFGPHGGHPHAMGMGPAQCMTQQADVSRLDYLKAFYESVAKTMTLTEKQAKVWKSYVDTRLAVFEERAKWRQAHKVPCMDEQTRLERRADKARLNVKLTEKVAQQRAELLKVLDPKQKLVLETYEFKKGPKARFHAGPQHRPHCNAAPCPIGKGPGMTPPCPKAKAGATDGGKV